MSKPKITPQPVSELGQLLGTEDRGQHPARVRELLQVARVPVLTIVIQHDPRGGLSWSRSWRQSGNSGRQSKMPTMDQIEHGDT